MQAFLPLALAVRAAPGQHLVAVGQEHVEQFLETEGAGLPVDEHQVVHAEGLLQRGEPVEVGQQRLRVHADLALHHQAGAVLPVGEVLDVGDAGQPLGLVHLVGDGRDDLLGADAVRKLGDGDGLPAAAALQRADLHPPAHAHHAAPGLVRAAHLVQAEQQPAGGQVGAGHELHELVERGVRVVDQPAGGLDHLAEVVRDHVRRHADRDAGRAVDQQVRERRRQHRGLGQRAVVVRLDVDGVLAQLAGEQHRLPGHPGLGVVVDETTGQEGVVGGFDSNGIDLRRLVGRDRDDLLVSIARIHDGQDRGKDLGVFDAVDDAESFGLPPLDTIEVVAGEPLASAAPTIEVDAAAHVVGHKGDMVLTEPMRAQRRVPQHLCQHRLLGTEESDTSCESPDVSRPGYHQAVLHRATGPGVVASTGDHTELREQFLHLSSQTLAVAGVLDGEAAVGDPDSAVTFEEGHQEGPLDAPPPCPDEFGHELVVRIVVVDAVGEPYLLEIFLQRLPLGRRAVALIVLVNRLQRAAHGEVHRAVLVEKNVAAAFGSLGEVIDQLLLFERQGVETGNFVTDDLDVVETVDDPRHIALGATAARGQCGNDECHRYNSKKLFHARSKLVFLQK